MTTITGQGGPVLGPLTTGWSMPWSCSLHIVHCSECSMGFFARSCTTDEDGIDRGREFTGCWPPATPRAGTPTHPFLGWGFYSPGTACPTGYREACTAQYGMQPEWDIQFVLEEGETAIGCCPEGYTCTNQNGNTCIQIASTRVVIETARCSNMEIESAGTGTFPDLVTLTTVDSNGETGLTVSERQLTLVAPMFQVNYRASDVIATSTSSSRMTSPTTSNTSNSSSISAISSSNPEFNTSSGLSAGTIGGIVGGVVGGILIIAVAIWLLWRRRKREQSVPSTKGEKPSASSPLGENDRSLNTYQPFHTPVELESSTQHTIELDCPRLTVEMPAEYFR